MSIENKVDVVVVYRHLAVITGEVYVFVFIFIPLGVIRLYFTGF